MDHSTATLHPIGSARVLRQEGVSGAASRSPHEPAPSEPRRGALRELARLVGEAFAAGLLASLALALAAFIVSSQAKASGRAIDASGPPRTAAPAIAYPQAVDERTEGVPARPRAGAGA